MRWNDYCVTFIPQLLNQFKQNMGYDLNLSQVHSFTEKIQWLKIYDATMLKTFCADKVSIHDYCKYKLGKDICIPIIATYNHPQEIQWGKLPNRFVIKCNHGSGYNNVVHDKATLNISKATQTIMKWLQEDYGRRGCELHYSLIPKKILIEEFKSNNGFRDLIDYKCYCFNGVPKFWQVITDRNTNEMKSHYDIDWKYAPQYDQTSYKSLDGISKPPQYQDMLNIATKLSEDFKFVRVDFYIIDSQVFLGELTFTPVNGFIKYKQQTTDKMLGECLQLK